ncbi:MAG: hypothetical protein RL479_2624 [Verrucomicrobiota bacterium]
MEAVGEAVDVEQRQAAEETVRRGDPPSGDQREGVGREVTLGQHCSLGRASRARSVDQGHRGVGVGGHRDPGRLVGGGRGGQRGDVPDRRPRGQVDGEVGRGYHGGGGGVGDDVGQFARPVEDVHRDERQPELRRGEPEVDHLGPVLQEEGEAVAGAEAPCPQQVGEAVAARLQFPEGQRGDGAVRLQEFEATDVRAALQGEVKQGEQAHPAVGTGGGKATVKASPGSGASGCLSRQGVRP